MPNDAWTAAIKEAFALAKSTEVYLDTLTLSHPLVTPSIYLVKDREDWNLGLEASGGTKTFKACAFRMALPPSGEGGLQDLNIAIDNTDEAISDFINTVKASTVKVVVTFRPYLMTDTSGPQMDPPLALTLSDVVMTPVEVTGRASFADIVNMPFATEMYLRSRFPSLSN